MVEFESTRDRAEQEPSRAFATAETAHADKFFKAVADGTRRRILLLLETRELSVGEIVAHFHLSQPTISRHLAVLREADLVADRRQGQHVIYRLQMNALTDSLSHFIGQFRRSPWFL